MLGYNCNHRLSTDICLQITIYFSFLLKVKLIVIRITPLLTSTITFTSKIPVSSSPLDYPSSTPPLPNSKKEEKSSYGMLIVILD